MILLTRRPRNAALALAACVIDGFGQADRAGVDLFAEHSDTRPQPLEPNRHAYFTNLIYCLRVRPF